MTISKVEEIRKYFKSREVIEKTYYVYHRPSKSSGITLNIELHSGFSSDPNLVFLHKTTLKKYADEIPNFEPLNLDSGNRSYINFNKEDKHRGNAN